MNKVIVSLLLVIAFGLLWSPAQAQEQSTGSGTTESLKKRIEKLIEEKRDQIEGVLSDLGIRKRGFIGEVQRVSEESITIRTKKGTEIVSVDGVTLLKASRTIAVKDIAVGDWVVVMGYVENDTFQARRILISAESLRPDPQIVEVGSITNVDRTSLTLQARGSGDTITVTTTRTTEYQDIQGNEIARTDLTEDTQALVVGVDEDSEKTATLIRVLTVIEDEATAN